MSDRLPKTTAALRDGLERGLHLGAQLYVSLGGQEIASLAVGESRPGTPMTNDTLVLWMSMGKPVTAILIARLFDAGKLDVQQPVSEFLPEFAQHGKGQITIAHLLTHSGGFRHVGSNWTGESWEAVISRINAAALEEEWVVGETAGYHTSSSWFILAELARRIGGYEDPREMYRREVFEPLAMQDCWLGMPRHRWMDYGTRVGYAFDTSRLRASRQDGERTSAGQASPRPLASANTEAGSTMCRPGGNARGPMRELGRFYEQLLIDRGDLAALGASRGRLLHTATARTFTSRQLADVYDKTFGTRLDWGYGFVINSAAGKFPYSYGPHASADAFGHSGNQSSCAFADPPRGLVVCWATNGMPGELPHQRRQRAINAAIYEDLGLV